MPAGWQALEWHWIYAPPWRCDGERYGPGTSTYERLIRDHELRGFWHPPEAVPRERYDGHRIMALLATGILPMRERQVAALYWAGHSRRDIARDLCIATSTVRELIRRVRRRVHR